MWYESNPVTPELCSHPSFSHFGHLTSILSPRGYLSLALQLNNSSGFYFIFSFLFPWQSPELKTLRRKRERKVQKESIFPNTDLGSKNLPHTKDPVTYRQKLVKATFFPQFSDKTGLPKSVPIPRSDSPQSSLIPPFQALGYVALNFPNVNQLQWQVPIIPPLFGR